MSLERLGVVWFLSNIIFLLKDGTRGTLIIGRVYVFCIFPTTLLSLN